MHEYRQAVYWRESGLVHISGTVGQAEPLDRVFGLFLKAPSSSQAEDTCPSSKRRGFKSRRGHTEDG